MTIEFVGGKTFISTDPASEAISLGGLIGGLATAPAAGDLVIVAYSVGDNRDRAISILTADYIQTEKLYVNDTHDTNYIAGFKIMGASPDADVLLSETFGTAGKSVVIHVWRGVDPVSPMDVAYVTAIGSNSRETDPPPITPVTAGAVIVVMGMDAFQDEAEMLFTAPDLENFFTSYNAWGVDVTTGVGSKAWAGGAYDPAFVVPFTTTFNSWAAITMALRPAADVPVAEMTVPIAFADTPASGATFAAGTSSAIELAPTLSSAEIIQ